MSSTEKDMEIALRANPWLQKELLRQHLSAAGAKGGKKSRRTLTKKEARRIAKVRWAAGAGRGAVKASDEEKTQAQNDEADRRAEDNR